jgi:hypothetical protein
VRISDNQISYGYNLTYQNPMLQLTGMGGTALSFQNNTNAGYGSGVWLSLAYDEQHFISDNVWNGPLGTWTAVLPTAKLRGIYQDQIFRYDLPTPVVNLTGPVIYVHEGIGAYTFICDAAAGQVQVNLQYANESTGAVYKLIKTDTNTANNCAFIAAGSDPINGGTGINQAIDVTAQLATISLTCDGIGWWSV